ncbi:hypothetical protein D3C80_1746470 [compost metagenome]
MYGFTMALAAPASIEMIDFLETFQCRGYQQAAPLMISPLVHATENHVGHTHVQRLETEQGIALAQYGGATERVPQGAVDVPDLALGVEQLSVVAVQPLHPAFPASSLIGLFDPLTLLAPEKIEAVRALGLACTPYDHRHYYPLRNK